MNINTTLLIIAALVPAVWLCVYVFRKDRVEKEPIGLLLQLFALGALVSFAAAYLEDFVLDIIDAAFKSHTHTMADGTVVMTKKVFYVYNFIKYFFGVALVEEAVKWLMLVQTTKTNDEFDSLFDGIIYAVFVSLGFAAIENVFYVTQYGWGNALARAVLSVPGHMFFGVMMGYHYSFWHITDKAKLMEQTLEAQDRIVPRAPFSSARSIALSLIVPIAAHGIYDYCCTLGTMWATVLFYAFVAFMYAHCFGKIKKMSDYDIYTSDYAEILIERKYPELSNK